jgi:hypothetical protein
MILKRCVLVLFGVAVAILLGCGNSGGPSSSSPSESNVLTITINPSSAAVCTFANEPCTQVTICQLGTSNCQAITDVLVDTGSSGLRIFASALTSALPFSNSGECMYFGGGTDWGRVQTVDVILGKEPVVSVPIQVIDPTFAGQYTSAGQPASNICGVALVDSSPLEAGFNGILGIGLFPFDGGAYYNCASLPCAAVAVSVSQQVQNPVGLLPVDNNGVIVALPSVPASGGSPSVTGSLILGIGTESNNQPSGVTVLPTDSSGQIVTHFNPSPGVSTQEAGIFDSGSSAIFFSDSSLSIPLCPGNLSFLYCPSSPVTFSAANTTLSGSPSNVVSFQITNPMALLSSGNAAISNMGGPAFSTGLFDWGLPFFFGRSVYVGLGGKMSVLGTGPLWAY